MMSTKTLTKDVGQRLQDTRKSRGLEISNVSQQLHISEWIIKKIEDGYIDEYYPEIYALTCIYSVPIHDIFCGFFDKTNSSTYFLRNKTEHESEEIQQYVLDYIEFQKKLHKKTSYLSSVSRARRSSHNRRLSSEVLKTRAKDIINEHNLYKLPINLYQVACNLGINVTFETLPNKLYNLRGFCHKENGFSLITINRNHPVVLQRFTMAHELHHLLYDANSIPFSCGSYNELDVIEQNAERFAAEILMPYTLIQKLISYPPNVNYLTISLVADHFQVSYEAAAIRLHNFGLIDSASEVCKSSYRKKDKEKTNFLLKNKLKYLKAVFGLETGIKELQMSEKVDSHYLCGSPIFDNSHEVCWYCGLELQESQIQENSPEDSTRLIKNHHRQSPSNLSPKNIISVTQKKEDYKQLSLNLKVN